jgi:hypothetical protein
MSNKTTITKIALAAALAIGTVGAALASNENEDVGGYRLLGAGGVVTDGVNPAFHQSLRGGANNSGGNSYGFAPIHTSKHPTK